MKKIYLVDSSDGNLSRQHLVRAHTSAGAEKFVRAKFKPTVTAKVPTQDELLAAREEGVAIEDATAETVAGEGGES